MSLILNTINVLNGHHSRLILYLVDLRTSNFESHLQLLQEVTSKLDRERSKEMPVWKTKKSIKWIQITS